MKINNCQGHLISKLTKYVLQINLLELKLICVKSGAIKFKYIIKIWHPHFYTVFWRYLDFIVLYVIFILFSTNASIKTKTSILKDKQMVSNCYLYRVSFCFYLWKLLVRLLKNKLLTRSISCFIMCPLSRVSIMLDDFLFHGLSWNYSSI